MRRLRPRQSDGRQVLQRLRGAPPDGGPGRRARGLHAQAPRREDPHVQERPRGRAQAGDRPLRGPQGLDGAAGRSRSRGGPRAARRRPRAHDGGGAPLRGHRQPGHGRRHHGALRGAARARGPRGPCLLRGAPHEGHARAPRGGGRADARCAPPDPHRPQLRRGRRPLDRQRSGHGLHRRRPDDPPRGPDGADGRPGHRAGDAPHAPPRGRRGDRALARPAPREGPRHPTRGPRARGRRPGTLAAPHRHGAVEPLRRTRRGARAPARPAHRGGRRVRADRRGHGGAGRGQVAAGLRVRQLGMDARVDGARVELALLRQGQRLAAGHRRAASTLGARRARRRRRGPGQGHERDARAPRRSQGRAAAHPVAPRRTAGGRPVLGTRAPRAARCDPRRAHRLLPRRGRAPAAAAGVREPPVGRRRDPGLPRHAARTRPYRAPAPPRRLPARVRARLGR